MEAIEGQTHYAQAETSACLLAINQLKIEEQTLSSLVNALRSQSPLPAFDPSIVAYVYHLYCVSKKVVERTDLYTTQVQYLPFLLLLYLLLLLVPMIIHSFF